MPIYSPQFFSSDFCQWELQQAITRDPIGKRGRIRPIVYQPTDLPAYCSLIQAKELTSESQLLSMVRHLRD